MKNLLVQLKVGNVSARAHRALEVFDVVVVLLVNSQAVPIAKRLIAYIALVKLLRLVNSLEVPQQLRSCFENLAAFITSEASLELVVVELDTRNDTFRLLGLSPVGLRKLCDG